MLSEVTRALQAAGGFLLKEESVICTAVAERGAELVTAPLALGEAASNLLAVSEKKLF